MNIMKTPVIFAFLAGFSLICAANMVLAASEQLTFMWPKGKVAALSLSFDDSRRSQVFVGHRLFQRLGMTATFYVQPGPVSRLQYGWARMVEAGHEIGNHTINHPCSKKFDWVQPEFAAETYTLERMKDELTEANIRIEKLLGVSPKSYAYPCGKTDLGPEATSYVPLAASMFHSARTYLDENDNDPNNVEFGSVHAFLMDEMEFEDLLPLLEQARQEGHWIVLAGHEIGTAGYQTTRVETLEKLGEYCQDPKNGNWLAPVGTIVDYIRWKRSP